MLRQPRIPPGRPPGLAEVIERGRIGCRFARPGRFIGAHRPGHYETLARDFETLRREGYEILTAETAEEALRICSAGRPLCFLCGQPINPDGHACPRSNGHTVLEAG